MPAPTTARRHLWLRVPALTAVLAVLLAACAPSGTPGAGQPGGIDRQPGRGLGLATARRIVERHGGRIWMEDNPGGGTAVCFTLPSRAR